MTKKLLALALAAIALSLTAGCHLDLDAGISDNSPAPMQVNPFQGSQLFASR